MRKHTVLSLIFIFTILLGCTGCNQTAPTNTPSINNSDIQPPATTETPVTFPVMTEDGAVAGSNDSAQYYAVDANGTLWRWGKSHIRKQVADNVTCVRAGWSDYGYLQEDGTLSIVGRGKKVYTYEDVAFFDCEMDVFAFIKKDGTLWIVGKDQYLNPDAETGIPLYVMDEVKQVSLGDSMILVLKTDGSVWGWGDNINGQLGIGEISSSESDPVKILDDAVAIEASSETCFAIKSDGTLWGWGRNTSGKVGIGSSDAVILTPSLIMEDVVYITGGAYFALAIKSDNSLWGWGAKCVLGKNISKPGILENPQKLFDNIATACGLHRTNFYYAVTTEGRLIDADGEVMLRTE